MLRRPLAREANIMPMKTATKTRTRQRAQHYRVAHTRASPLSQKKNGRQAPRRNDSHPTDSLPPTFSTPPYQRLRGLYLAREALRQDIQAIENRIRGHEKRGEHLLGLAISGFHDLDTMRLWKRNIEAGMKLITQDLPPWTRFLAETDGVAELGASVMLACIGDPAQYKNPSAIWKRMGVAVITAEDSEGKQITERQRRRKDKRLAAIHGYDSTRHAVIWNAAVRLCQNNEEYMALALERQTYRETRGWKREANCKRCSTGDPHLCGHAGKDARRYAIKRLLRELWIVCQ